jgi:hypothetical protein
MKQPHFLIKLLVLSSSISLTVGLIGCRASGLNWFKPPAPEKKPSDADTDPVSPEQADPKMMMPSTKSINVRGVTTGLTPAGTFTPDKVESPWWSVLS